MTSPVRVWVLLGFACGCSGEDPAPVAPRPTTWHAAGATLRDGDGRAALLRGVNLAGAHKQAPYFGFHEREDFERVSADWGMNALRFLISWSAVEPSEGQYDDAYLDQVAERMRWAAEADLVVVLDMHQDLYGEGFIGGNGAPRWTCDEARYQAFEPKEPWFLGYSDENMVACYDALWGSEELHAHYAAAWAHVAERLAGEPAVIGFDIMNEPYWGSAEPNSLETNVLTPFYERVVAAVRAHAPTWIAFIEPSSSRNLGIPTTIGPFTFTNYAYAPHSYDTAAEQGMGYNPASRNGLLFKIDALRAEADALGAPLWIGEYGGSEDAGGITEYMDANHDGAADTLASLMYWAYDADDGYGLLRPDGSEKVVTLDAIVRPFPARVAGTLSAFAYDEALRAFSCSYEADATVTAPTRISLPERVYPDGYVVECGGCTHHAEGGWLVVDAAPAGAVTLTVQPAE